MVLFKILYWFFSAILIFKTFSNILIPQALSKKKVIDESTGRTGGISIMPLLDFLCFSILLVLAYFIDQEFIYKLHTTFFVFGGMILTSFLIAVLGVVYIGWRRSKET